MGVHWPNELVRNGKDVIIYGAGCCGQQLVDQNSLNNYCHIIAIIDKKEAGKVFNNIPIISVNDAPQCCPDAYLISSPLYSEEMRSELSAIGVNPSKIYDVVQSLNPMSIDLTRPTFCGKYEDYVRYRSLELVTDLLKNNNIPGALAEAGVYRGNFCRVMNYLMPDRDIFLYDTFEGFVASDMDIDVDCGYTPDEVFGQRTGKAVYMPETPGDRQIALIRQLLSSPEKAHFRKGNFPDTTKDDKNVHFCLVSLDMDLYRPMKDALLFFWPRMVPGGYIFIHDYNSTIFKGVKEAVCDVERNLGFIHKMPLSDTQGTIVLLK